MPQSTDKRVLPVMQAVFRLICQEVNSTFSVRASSLLDEDDGPNKLLKLKVDARLYRTAHGFSGDYAVVSFLSKWKGLVTGIDTARVALDSWSAAEMMCHDTNVRIRDFLRNGSSVMFENRSVSEIISIAQRKIEKVIGPFPQYSLTHKRCKWSGGATFDLRRGTPLTKKMTGRISCTESALPYLRTEIENDPAWAESLIGHRPCGPFSILKASFKIVKGNRFLTVPKNAKTDRCIAAEPTGNTFLQQGVGQFIRRRLKRFGVDLDDQSWNQLLARKAESLGLATLDLSMASDTVSSELIFLLLPIEWALYLDSLRSRYSRVKGEWVYLSKFSSMGNSFTFELESLIFWAITEACLDDDGECITGVYGDDIVTPASAAPRVIAALGWFGFNLNKEKSFTEGPFYESCGKHYFHGQEVTPVYQKKFIDSDKEPVDFISEIVRLHNRVHRWVVRYIGLDQSLSFRAKLRRIVINACKGYEVPKIPLDAVSDDGLLTDVRELDWDCNHGFHCRVYVFRPKFKRIWNQPLLAYKLRRPSYLNADPKGYGVQTLGGEWIYCNQYFHSSYEVSYLK
jgi:hypothetical protein